VLDALEKEGLSQNTVVFFASDNGAPLQESSGSNGELSEGKGLLFEGGNRVPLMVRWPGHATAGTHVAAPVELLDVTATTLALAGAPKEALAELDGLDLAPLLAGETPPERTFFWKVGPSAAIRKGAWKLVTSKDNRWLFDLGTDPEEHADLVDAKGAVADTLATELDAWIAKLPKPLWGNEGNETPVTVLGKQYWVTY
jgi:arylsulfatase A-like enzyme